MYSHLSAIMTESIVLHCVETLGNLKHMKQYWAEKVLFEMCITHQKIYLLRSLLCVTAFQSQLRWVGGVSLVLENWGLRVGVLSLEKIWNGGSIIGLNNRNLFLGNITKVLHYYAKIYMVQSKPGGDSFPIWRLNSLSSYSCLASWKALLTIYPVFFFF